jgi:hypothetical protein
MVNINDEQRRDGELIVALNSQFGLALVAQPIDDWKCAMVGEIDRLIQADVANLINILYRLDISESKLERLLKENPSIDAAAIITDLVIERQLEKIASRKKYSGKKEDIDEDERW